MMKIKTLKIKVENENQEFDFADFFEGNYTIYKTEASLQKEKDGYYWHAFITFEPNGATPYFDAIQNFNILQRKEITLPKGFEDEVNNYLKNNPPKKARSQNLMKCNIEKLWGIENLNDFNKIKNLGKISIREDAVFYQGLLDIIKKYN
jgi:hypothetical protein